MNIAALNFFFLPIVLQVKLVESKIPSTNEPKIFYSEWIGMTSQTWPYLIHLKKAPHTALRFDNINEINLTLKSNVDLQKLFNKDHDQGFSNSFNLPVDQFLTNFLTENDDKVSINPVHVRLFLMKAWYELVCKVYPKPENIIVNLTAEQGLHM